MCFEVQCVIEMRKQIQKFFPNKIPKIEIADMQINMVVCVGAWPSEKRAVVPPSRQERVATGGTQDTKDRGVGARMNVAKTKGFDLGAGCLG